MVKINKLTYIAASEISEVFVDEELYEDAVSGLMKDMRLILKQKFYVKVKKKNHEEAILAGTFDKEIDAIAEMVRIVRSINENT